MKRNFNFFTFCLALLLCALPALSQITMTSGDIPQTVGQQFTEMSSAGFAVTVDLGSAGPNQTWDLRGTEVTVESNLEIVNHAGTPNPSWFPSANLILKSTVDDGSTYGYSEITSGYLKGVGMVWDLPDTTYMTPWENEPPQYVFPMQYESNWMTRLYWEQIVEDITMTMLDTAWISIDGWGTVIIDDVGSVSCLRMKAHHHIIMTIMGMPMFDDWTWSYWWLAPGYILVAHMESMDDDEHFTEGYFARAGSGVDAQPPIQILPLAFQLENAFPNPFNPETTIPYSVNQQTDIRLAIYNALGQEVKTLVSGRVIPGSYTASWNGMDNFGNQVGAGVYYCRMINPEGISASQKLTLVK